MGIKTLSIITALDSNLELIWRQLKELETETAKIQAQRDVLWNQYNFLLAKRADALQDGGVQ